MPELTAAEFAKLSEAEKLKRCKELSPQEYAKYRMGYEVPTIEWIDTKKRSENVTNI